MKPPRIKNYKKNWENWVSRNDQFLTRCFSTITFGANGFDDNISSEREIHKYGGGIHFISTEELEDILGGVSEVELGLLIDIIKKIAILDKDYKRKYYKGNETSISSIACIPSLMRAIIQLRMLKALKSEPNIDELIIDIGPGTGYFGLLAAMSGYKLLSTDISSGYFCFQRFLYENILGEKYKFIENLKKLDQQAHLQHLPVWVWTDREFKIPGETKIIFANHVLNEMHRHSLLYLLQLIENSKIKEIRFAIEGWGYGSRTNPQLHQQTQKIFKLYGYKTVDILKRAKGHDVEILKKEKNKAVENIKGMTSTKYEKIKILEGKILENSDKLSNKLQGKIWQPDSNHKIYSARETYTILLNEFNEKSTYTRLDKNFLDFIGVASDHNRLFFNEMEKGEYI